MYPNVRFSINFRVADSMIREPIDEMMKQVLQPYTTFKTVYTAPSGHYRKLNMESAADMEIVQEVLNGNTQAYSLLVSRYQGYAFTLALRIVPTREDAEEVVQDSFVKAYCALADFKGNSKFSTWLYTIVSRTSLNVLKKRRPAAHVLDTEAAADAVNNLPSTLPQVENTLDQKSQRSVIAKVIALLKPEDAELITLFYLHEQSLEEISYILGTDLNTIKVRLHRARLRLKKVMETHYASELKK
jgi:RNA polymerase sigma factor (sigma-70 family)